MQHYWQHYRFTNDLDFLQDKVYPALTEAVKFYFDWLVEDPRDGYLIAAPSTSPENQFIMSNGDTVATCLGSAMDQQIIAEVFDNYIETCRIMNIENSFWIVLFRKDLSYDQVSLLAATVEFLNGIENIKNWRRDTGICPIFILSSRE